jgi:hypothetical protein
MHPFQDLKHQAIQEAIETRMSWPEAARHFMSPSQVEAIHMVQAVQSATTDPWKHAKAASAAWGYQFKARVGSRSQESRFDFLKGITGLGVDPVLVAVASKSKATESAVERLVNETGHDTLPGALQTLDLDPTEVGDGLAVAGRLAAMAPGGSIFIQRLLSEDRPPNERRLAVDLCHLRDDGIQILAALLKSPSDLAREAAVVGLVELEGPSHRLFALADDESELVRKAVARNAWQVPFLLHKLIEDPSENVRLEALYHAVRQLRECPNQMAFMALFSMAEDPSAAIRKVLVQQVGTIRLNEIAVLLTKMARGTSQEDRFLAAEGAMIHLRHGMASGWPILAELGEDPESDLGKLVLLYARQLVQEQVVQGEFRDLVKNWISEKTLPANKSTNPFRTEDPEFISKATLGLLSDELTEHSGLKHGGIWTDTLIRKYLGNPDYLMDTRSTIYSINAIDNSPLIKKFYLKVRIDLARSSDQWQQDQKKVTARRETRVSTASRSANDQYSCILCEHDRAMKPYDTGWKCKFCGYETRSLE